MIEGGEDAQGNSYWVCMRGGYVGYLEVNPDQPPLCLTAASVGRTGTGWSVSPGSRAMALSATLR